jgi:hypothetical protein
LQNGLATILGSDGSPPVLLYHFAVDAVYAVKAYDQHGQLTNRYETASKVVNFNNLVENLSGKFSGDDTVRYFQGDGDAPPKIIADGTVQTADYHHKFHLYNTKAQKQAGLHLTSDKNGAKEVQ